MNSLLAQSINSLPSATEILQQAFAVYRKRIGTFLGIMLIRRLIMFFPIIALIFLTEILLPSYFSLFVFFAIFLLIGISIIYFWGETALIYAIKNSEEKINVIGSYKRGWKRTTAYIWIYLLVIIVLIAGFFLLFVPGIIFSVWFAFAGFVLINEDLRGINALWKSREYVRGRWFGVFWRLFFISGLYFLISLVLSLTLKFLGIPFAPQIGNLIGEFFFFPLFLTYCFLLYQNLSILKGEKIILTNERQKRRFIGFLIGLIIAGIILLFGFFMVFILTMKSTAKKARDMKREIDIQQIQTALEIYYNDYGSYPPSLNELEKYFLSLPVDPSTNKPYEYQRLKEGKDYKICTQLESTKTQKCLEPQY